MICCTSRTPSTRWRRAAVGAARRRVRRAGDVHRRADPAFFDCFADVLADDDVFAAIAAANAADVDAAPAQRPLDDPARALTESMRAGMVAGLRSWRDAPTRRRRSSWRPIDHDGWSVAVVARAARRRRLRVRGPAERVRRRHRRAAHRQHRRVPHRQRRARHGTGDHARTRVAPALAAAGLPARRGAAGRVAPRTPPGGRCSPTPRLALAVARGSGPAVAQLGAVARQHGVPVSLHGTGGAWIVGRTATPTPIGFAAAVEHSLDRKVCNTLNVCCIPRVARLLGSAVERGRRRGADVPRRERGTEADDPPGRRPTSSTGSAHEWEWEDVPEVLAGRWSTTWPTRSICATGTARGSSASLISEDAAEHDGFYAAVDAPFVGDGFTRWVDGQFALDQPELGPVELAGRPAVRPRRRAVR